MTRHLVETPTLELPLLIYDGECRFCRSWIRRWQQATEGRVDYEEFQKVGQRFPEISRSEFESAVQLIEPDGRVWSGADAVLRALEFGRKEHWLVRLRKVPGFMFLARVCYRFIATHRTLFSRIAPA
jgi:predicted DCC family thiol-disulfide oxidoreductase YuxK